MKDSYKCYTTEENFYYHVAKTALIGIITIMKLLFTTDISLLKKVLAKNQNLNRQKKPKKILTKKLTKKLQLKLPIARGDNTFEKSISTGPNQS